SADLRAVPRKGVGYGVLVSLASLTEAERRSLTALESQICFNYMGQTGRDLEQDEVRASPLPIGVAISEANQSPWLLDIMGHVDQAGRLLFELQHPDSAGPQMEMLAASFRQQLLDLNARAKESPVQTAAAPSPVRDGPSLIARNAAPGDYADICDVCIRTSGMSRWVADRLAASTWLDPLWQSDETAKFVLESGGRVVGYLLGARD